MNPQPEIPEFLLNSVADTAKEAIRLQEAHGGFWGECPGRPVSDWLDQIRNEETRLGYWEWAVVQDDWEDEE